MSTGNFGIKEQLDLAYIPLLLITIHRKLAWLFNQNSFKTMRVDHAMGNTLSRSKS